MKPKKISAAKAPKPLAWFAVVTREGAALAIRASRARAARDAKLASRVAGPCRVVRVQEVR